MNKEENLYTPNCIRTFTGKYVNILEPTEDMICIEDIAHSLSMQCRFGGHLPVFYSVAQHCIECSLIANRSYKLEALMHDASEAYLLDIPTPVKKLLVGYDAIEENFMKVIFNKFNLLYSALEKIKIEDKYMLEKEWDLLMINGDKKYEPLYQNTQRGAEYRFLLLFKSLQNDRARISKMA